MELVAWLVDNQLGVVTGMSGLLNIALVAAFARIHNRENASFKTQQMALEASYKTAQSDLDKHIQIALREQQVLLDAAVHANKTSFSRIDEMRTKAIVKLDAALRLYMFKSMIFPLPSLSQEKPYDLAIGWVFEMKALALDVVKAEVEMGLFLPDLFCVTVGTEWVSSAIRRGAQFGDAFVEESSKEGFNDLPRFEQSRVLKAAQERVSGQDDGGFGALSRDLRLGLSRMFHGEPHLWGTPTTWPVLRPDAGITVT